MHLPIMIIISGIIINQLPTKDDMIFCRRLSVESSIINFLVLILVGVYASDALGLVDPLIHPLNILPSLYSLFLLLFMMGSCAALLILIYKKKQLLPIAFLSGISNKQNDLLIAEKRPAGDLKMLK